MLGLTSRCATTHDAVEAPPPSWPGSGSPGKTDGATLPRPARPRQPQRRERPRLRVLRPGPCTRPRTGLRPPLTRPPPPWAGDTGRLRREVAGHPATTSRRAASAPSRPSPTRATRSSRRRHRPAPGAAGRCGRGPTSGRPAGRARAGRRAGVSPVRTSAVAIPPATRAHTDVGGQPVADHDAVGATPPRARRARPRAWPGGACRGRLAGHPVHASIAATMAAMSGSPRPPGSGQ